MNTSKNIKHGTHIQNNRGFTLLEALLGFLILSIGMLGIASLQALSLKAGKTSVYNSVVIMKVDEILESMRANPSVIALDAYDAAGTAAGLGVNNSCTSSACDADKLAQEDIFWWKKNLKAGLPDTATATVSVAYAGVPSKMAIATVEIKWNERDKDSEVAAEKTFTATTNICTENPC